ncbi:MAG: hypothetical protein ACE5FL_15855, partial [Myxococcota bacterium]
MMRWNDFGRSLVFGASAAAGVVPFTLVAAPPLGWSSALAAYAVLCSAVYLVGLGPNVRRGATAALLAGALGSAAWGIAPSPRDAILAAALVLALCRSGLLYRARFARALALEGVLGVAALGLAGQLLSGSTFSAVLAVWSFFLVQSAFFLVGGIEVRSEPAPDLD